MKEILLSIFTICTPCEEKFIQISDGPTPMWVRPSRIICISPETFVKTNKKTVILFDTGEQFMIDEDVNVVIKNINKGLSDE